uniref:Uncharacterized protein n=1 Tax=Lepeophtheirus salmonis TaxID=72036 RepID=A0A0K2UJZ1_LEPSM
MHFSTFVSTIGTSIYLGVATGLFNGLQDLMVEVPKVLKLVILEGILGMFFGMTLGQLTGGGMYIPFVVFHIVRAFSYHVSVNFCRRLCTEMLPIGESLWRPTDIIKWFQDVIGEIKNRFHVITSVVKSVYLSHELAGIHKIEIILRILISNIKFHALPDGALASPRDFSGEQNSRLNNQNLRLRSPQSRFQELSS